MRKTSGGRALGSFNCPSVLPRHELARVSVAERWNIGTRLRAACALLFGLFTATALGQVAERSDEARLAAVRRAFVAMDLGETLARGLKGAIEEGARGTPVPDYILESLAPSAVEARYVPILAKYVSTGIALEVARFFESSIGRKASQLIFNPYSLLASVTPMERTVIDSFLKGPVWRGWERGVAAAQPEAGQMMHAWTEELSAMRVMREPDLTGPGGRAMVEHYVAMIRKFAQRSAAARTQYSTEVIGLELGSLLTAARLVSKGDLADNRTRIFAYESVLERYRAAMSALLSEAHDEVKKLHGPDPFLKKLTEGFELALARAHHRDRTFGENQGQLIETARRLLTLCEDQLGRTSIGDNGRLVFEDVAALDNFHALTARLNALSRNEFEMLEDAGRDAEKAQRIFGEPLYR